MTDQFFTDPKLAARIAQRFVKPGEYVLEPSAGDGALVRAALAVGGVRVEAVEVDEGLAQGLTRMQRLDGLVTVTKSDFLVLAATRTYTLCLANPPYGDGADVNHTEHMLDFAPRVVVLLRANVQFLRSFHKRVLTKARLKTAVKFLARGVKFYGPDHKGHHARHEYEVLELVRRPKPLPTTSKALQAASVRTEWW